MANEFYKHRCPHERYVPFPFFEELFSWNDVVVTAGVVVVKERVEDPSDVEDEMGNVDVMLSVQI